MTPDRSTLRTVLRRLVLGAFTCTAALIVLLITQAVLSAAGVSSDPHGYAIFAAIFCSTILTPIALALWLLYRFLRRRDT